MGREGEREEGSCKSLVNMMAGQCVRDAMLSFLSTSDNVGIDNAVRKKTLYGDSSSTISADIVTSWRRNDGTLTSFAGLGFSAAFVCLCLLYPHDISNTDGSIGSPNLTNNCSTMSPKNAFISGSKCQGHGSVGHKNSVDVSLGTLVSAGFF